METILIVLLVVFLLGGGGWGLSLARLVRSLERVTPLLDSICGVYEVSDIRLPPRTLFQVP